MIDRTVLSRATRFALCGALLLLGTVLGFSPSTALAQSGGQVTTLESLGPGWRIELDGVTGEDGIVRARKVTVEEPDSTPEVKGTISAIDLEAGTLTIPPFTIFVNDETDIDDEDEEDSFDFEELQVGWRLEVDVIVENGTLIAEEIGVDKVPDDDKIGLVEIEAFIEAVSGTAEADTLVLTLLGVECRVPEDAEFAIKGAVGVSIRRDIDEGGRGSIRYDIGSTKLIVGGEIQVDYDLRRQFELDEDTDRDTSTIDLQLTLDAEWRITSDFVLFAKATTTQEEIIFDQDRDLEGGEETRLTELYAIYNIPDSPFTVQLGRQRYDDDREWFYDAELDGARLAWSSGDYSAEYSYNELIRDNRGFDDLQWQLFVARYEYERKSNVSFHIIDIVDDSDADESPFYVGLAAVGRWKGDEHQARYWGHYAFADGVTGTEELEAHAIDFGGAFQWRKAPLAPYVFGGYAWASGDDSPGNGTNKEYRQSGLEDNNDKVFGVASYRYYGEMFRPELSNMEIWSIGAGIRPNDHFSVDVIFHKYDQDVASATLRDSRLRASPDGNDTDLGMEFDLVLGLSDLWGAWDFELDIGYFIPGDAFETTDDPATWVAMQIEYKF